MSYIPVFTLSRYGLYKVAAIFFDQKTVGKK